MSENKWHSPGTEDIYLCAALDFDLSHSWVSIMIHVFSIMIHVILDVSSLFASMAIPGNSIDPQ